MKLCDWMFVSEMHLGSWSWSFYVHMLIALTFYKTCRYFLTQEAHEQGINAVRFSRSSDLLATGGTDRVIKLWEVRAGTLISGRVLFLLVNIWCWGVLTSLMMSSGLLTHRATLDGSTEGITCVEFDPTVSTTPDPHLYCHLWPLHINTDCCRNLEPGLVGNQKNTGW